MNTLGAWRSALFEFLKFYLKFSNNGQNNDTLINIQTKPIDITFSQALNLHKKSLILKPDDLTAIVLIEGQILFNTDSQTKNLKL